MSEQLKKIIANHPRLLDYYETGPVQRASVVDFVESLVTEIIAAVEAEQKFVAEQTVYSITDKNWCAAKVIQSKRIIANINLYRDSLLD